MALCISLWYLLALIEKPICERKPQPRHRETDLGRKESEQIKWHEVNRPVYGVESDDFFGEHLVIKMFCQKQIEHARKKAEERHGEAKEIEEFLHAAHGACAQIESVVFQKVEQLALAIVGWLRS